MSSVESLQKKIPLNNQIGLIGLLLCAFSSPLIMPLNIIAISEKFINATNGQIGLIACLLYTSPSPRDATLSRMPSSA